MIFLSKNEKNIESNKQLGQEKFPYFTLKIVNEIEVNGEKKLDWQNAKDICAFWKTKSGKGYNGKWANGFEFNTDGIIPYKKPAEGVKTSD